MTIHNIRYIAYVVYVQMELVKMTIIYLLRNVLKTNNLFLQKNISKANESFIRVKIGIHFYYSDLLGNMLPVTKKILINKLIECI